MRRRVRSFRRTARRSAVAVLTAVVLFAANLAGQQEPMAIVEMAERGIVWDVKTDHGGARLTVSGPHFAFERDFPAGERPVFKVGERKMLDGSYTWELRLTPRVDPKVRERLRAMREQGESLSSWELEREGIVPERPMVASGGFSVREGVVVTSQEPEKRRERRPPGQTVDGELRVEGDLRVAGAKMFAVPDPADATRSIEFAALEGPEVGTYYRGSATTEGGVATIELPGYFARVTEEAGLTVQLTPLGDWSRLYVAEKSTRQLVVRNADAGEARFDFLVQGVRRGYGEFTPAGDLESAEEGGDR